MLAASALPLQGDRVESSELACSRTSETWFVAHARTHSHTRTHFIPSIALVQALGNLEEALIGWQTGWTEVVTCLVAAMVAAGSVHPVSGTTWYGTRVVCVCLHLWSLESWLVVASDRADFFCFPPSGCFLCGNGVSMPTPVPLLAPSTNWSA